MLKEYIKVIPELKEEIDTDFLTESDLINIYAEWLSKGRPADRATQNGFIFETFSRRFIEDQESYPKFLKPAKEILMFLVDGDNQRQIWNEEKSTPDDLILGLTTHSLEISKIVECKISAHAIKSSYHQKESTKNTVKSLVGVLSGNYQEIKNESGRKVITNAREKLRKVCDLPINLSPNYRYVYVLPSDQQYASQNPRDNNLEVVNLPFSTSDIDSFRELYFTHLAKVNL